jgi:hypothetical protein
MSATGTRAAEHQLKVVFSNAASDFRKVNRVVIGVAVVIDIDGPKVGNPLGSRGNLPEPYATFEVIQPILISGRTRKVLMRFVQGTVRAKAATK